MAMQGRRQLDPETLRKVLIAMILQEQMRGSQGQAQAQPQQSSRAKVIEGARKAKGMYDDAKTIYNAGAKIYDGIAGANTLTPASQAAWNQAGMEASQQSWNAGADAASGIGQGAGEAGGSSTSGPSSMDGSYAAAVFSALNSGRRFMGTSRDEQKAYEASMAIPRAVAAYYTFGGSEALEGFARKQWGGTMKKLDKFNQTNPMSPVFIPMQASRLWTSDKWKTEGNRIKKLMEQGVGVPEDLQFRAKQTRGIRKEELLNPNYASDFVGMTKDGWVNNKFNNSRNESDMRYEDLMPYAAFGEKFGNDWYNKFNDAQRRAITQRAIDSGAVREHHGTVDVDWNKVGDVNPLIAQAQQAQTIQRPGAGQVARVSPGMYMNDKGRVQAAATKQQAMTQSYGNRIRRR